MSGSYTFANFTDYLQIMFGERSDLTSVGGVNLYEKWINLSYIRLTTRNRFYGLKANFYFPELEVTSSALSTADGTKTITTPTDALLIREVWDSTNDVRLDNISLRRYTDYTGRSDSNAEGKPIEWIRQDTNIYLYPTPDAVYTIYVYYRKTPAILTGTDKTVIGVEWDEVVLQLAYIIGKEWLGEYDKATQMKTALAESFAGIIGIYEWEQMAKRTIAKPESQVLLESGYK